jgi:hypothetical protein
MSNIVGFLENVGRNAAMAQATRNQLLQAMRHDSIAPVLRAALLSPDAKRIQDVLGDRGTMYCANFPVKTPPKKTPPKKAPVKAPPKKAPAKKAAKKGPAKRK